MDLIDWAIQCNFYFDVYSVPEHIKPRMAMIHFKGEAINWYKSCMNNIEFQSWEQLLAAVNAHFSEEKEEDVIDALNKIQQLGRVEDYIKKWISLKARKGYAQLRPYFPDSYYISSFISGLRPYLKQWVKIHKPSDLKELFSMAKQHEKATELTILRAKQGFKPAPVVNHTPRPPNEMERRVAGSQFYQVTAQ